MTKPLRLAFWSNTPQLSGREDNILQLCAWLLERGHQVTLLTNPNFPIWKEAIGRGLTAEAIKVRLKHGDLLAANSIGEFLQRDKTEALFITSSHDVHLAALAISIHSLATKLVFFQQNAIGVDKKDIIHDFLYQQLYAWLTPLKVQAEQVKAHTNFPEDRIAVIPTCIDVGQHDSKLLSVSASRNLLQIQAEGRFVVGTLGRFSPEKAYNAFVEALAILKERNFPVMGLMVGFGHEQQNTPVGRQLLKKIGELGLDDDMMYMDFTKEILPAFKAMDVFAQISLEETFSKTTVEAMASGVPVLAVRSQANLELLDQGNLGVVIAQNDAETLAKNIQKLFENPMTMRIQAEKAKAYVTTNFHHHLQCQLLEQLFNRE